MKLTFQVNLLSELEQAKAQIVANDTDITKVSKPLINNSQLKLCFVCEKNKTIILDGYASSEMQGYTLLLETRSQSNRLYPWVFKINGYDPEGNLQNVCTMFRENTLSKIYEK